MSMDELAVMDGGKCVLQLRGVRPFLSDKYDIKKHPNYKYLSYYDKRNKFNIEEFLQNKNQNTLKSSDLYEIYEIEIDE